MPNDSTKKPRELLRFGLPREGVTRERLEQLLDAAPTGPDDIIRYYSSQIIVEEGAPPRTTRASDEDDD